MKYMYYLNNQNINLTKVFPSGSVVKNLSAMQKMQIPFGSLGEEDPLEEGMATPSSILVWENPLVWGAWRAMMRGATDSDTTAMTALTPTWSKWQMHCSVLGAGSIRFNSNRHKIFTRVTKFLAIKLIFKNVKEITY